MLFTSYEFLAFLCITFLLYYLLPKRCQWALLLLASYGFYLFSGVENLLFIISTTLASFGVALWVDKIKTRAEDERSAHRDEMDKEARKAYKARQKKKSFGKKTMKK